MGFYAFSEKAVVSDEVYGFFLQSESTTVYWGCVHDDTDHLLNLYSLRQTLADLLLNRHFDLYLKNNRVGCLVFGLVYYKS